MELLRSKLKTVAPTQRGGGGGGEFGDAAVVAASLHTVRDQLKYLKSAVESSLELSKKKQAGGGGGAVVPPDHEAAVVEADLQVGVADPIYRLNNFDFAKDIVCFCSTIRYRAKFWPNFWKI
jgi:hypothetical protein